jgi:hypothetical protein
MLWQFELTEYANSDGITLPCELCSAYNSLIHTVTLGGCIKTLSARPCQHIKTK